MKLSAPIYRLKRQARLLSREEGVALHEALDRIAIREGFRTWSHLAREFAVESPAAKLYRRLKPGDLVLIAARPGQGKTLLALELAVEAVKAGDKSVFFTLEATEPQCRTLCGGAPGVEIDCSDHICADHIIAKLLGEQRRALAVVDYLQLLDQRRDTPPLMEQVRSLREFAKASGAIVGFISQVDRTYDPSERPLPGLEDVRLPNPLDLGAFDRTCFLHDGELRFG